MTNRTNRSSLAALLVMLLPAIAAAQGPRIQLDHLNRLADKAQRVVDIAVDSNTLRETAGFLAGKDANTGKVTELIQNITGIYVKGFEFSGPPPYTTADLDAIRKQVSGPGWSRIVSVREQNQTSEIYFWREKGENGGMVIISAEPDELTVVNIVGRIDLASLAGIGPLIPKLPGVSASSSSSSSSSTSSSSSSSSSPSPATTVPGK